MEPHHRSGLHDAPVDSGRPGVVRPDDGQHSDDPEGDTGRRGYAWREAARARDGRAVQPSPWSDPAFRRRLALGKILGSAIIIVPIAVIYFGRTLLQMSRAHDPDSASVVVLALLFAAGTAALILRYARKNLNRR